MSVNNTSTITSVITGNYNSIQLNEWRKFHDDRAIYSYWYYLLKILHCWNCVFNATTIFSFLSTIKLNFIIDFKQYIFQQ